MKAPFVTDKPIWDGLTDCQAVADEPIHYATLAYRCDEAKATQPPCSISGPLVSYSESDILE